MSKWITIVPPAENHGCSPPNSRAIANEGAGIGSVWECTCGTRFTLTRPIDVSFGDYGPRHEWIQHKESA